MADALRNPLPDTPNRRVLNQYGMTKRKLLLQLEREARRRPIELPRKEQLSALAAGPTAQFESAKKKGTTE